VTAPGSFSVARTPKIVFGAGTLAGIGELTKKFGTSVLLVQSRSFAENPGRSDRLFAPLRSAGIRYQTETVSGEPSPGLVDGVVAKHTGSGIHAVIAVGGGSALDAGKAIAAMLPLGGSVTAYLEEIGTKPHPGCTLPFIAVPTTAGTGSEASANTVLSAIGPDGYKKSLRHENFVPDIALVDPELTYTCPSGVTASCGMDALTQLIEAYVSPRATPFTDALIERALPGIPGFLTRAVDAGESDGEARRGMAWAALVSGIALANAGLGVVHGIASSVGAFFPLPHGVVCGTLLLPSIQATLDEIKLTGKPHPALEKYAAAGRLLSQLQECPVETGCAALTTTIGSLTERVRIPRLSAYGITKNDIAGIVASAGNRSHPVQLSKERITEIVISRL
jgi:alcohol dehydrogenase